VKKALASPEVFLSNEILLRSLLGNGLITLPYSEDWKRHRRIIQPCLQKRGIKDSMDTIAPKYAEMLVSCWKQCEGREIDANTHFSYCTVDVLGLVAFGHDFQSMGAIKKWSINESTADDNQIDQVSDKVIQSMNDFQRGSVILFVVLGLLKVQWLDVRTNRVIKVLNEAVDEIIEKARLKKNQRLDDDKNSKSAETPMSLLEVLLDAEDTDPTHQSKKRYLDNTELRSEVKTFITAGHDTTSTLLTWCAFVMCKYQDVQEKLYAEIMKNAPSSDDHSFPMSLDLLNTMPYFNAFLKEVLRLYPPVFQVNRETGREVTIKGIRIPAKTRVTMPIDLIHRHPDYWSNPDSFQPERWLNDECPASNKNAYLPFASGNRKCVGEYFAMCEAKLILAPLIRSFSFNFAPSCRNANFEISSFFLMKPKPDLKICVLSRT